jgi:hypothetical protein
LLKMFYDELDDEAADDSTADDSATDSSTPAPSFNMLASTDDGVGPGY